MSGSRWWAGGSRSASPLRLAPGDGTSGPPLGSSTGRTWSGEDGDPEGYCVAKTLSEGSRRKCRPEEAGSSARGTSEVEKRRHRQTKEGGSRETRLGIGAVSGGQDRLVVGLILRAVLELVTGRKNERASTGRTPSIGFRMSSSRRRADDDDDDAAMASLGAPPDSLRPIAPFVQRAKEMEKADEVIAYWCEPLDAPLPSRSTR